MLFRILWRNVYQAVMFLCLLWSTQGQSVTTDLSSSMKENTMNPYKTVSTYDLESMSFTSTPTKFSGIGDEFTSLHSRPEHLISTPQLADIPVLSSSENMQISHFNTILHSLVQETYKTFLTESDGTLTEHSDFIENPFYSQLATSEALPSPSLPVLHSEIPNQSVIGNSDDYGNFSTSSSKSRRPQVDLETTYLHFHTPLMSLLVASSSLPFSQEPSLSTRAYLSSILPYSRINKPINNESTNPDLSSVPPDVEHKKLLMLVLRAEDCSKFSKSDFEKMLAKLMAKFGFGDVVPEVSNAKCYSHLNINVTVGGAAPTLRFLPIIDGKNNFTVDVLNRTFRIVKLEKVDMKFEKSKSSNSSSSIIAAVAKHESIAYFAVGLSFGLVLVVCISLCCIKFCCLRKPPKRFIAPKSAHVRLRPEDYTLTPIPRPTSLYVDYYRGSVTADIYSTTSAGSLASTTPTVEQGVVQPFDTSIVPLEDSSALPLDSSRDPSVESVPVQSDLKTFHIHSLAGKGLRNTATDSKEQLNPKQHSKKVESKASGVANPTFQRY